MLAEQVDDSETLVRVIKTPFHLTGSKKALTRGAFYPPPGVDKRAISVIRQLMGDNYCKDKGVEVAGETYIGLAAGKAGPVREAGGGVEDAPGEYPGHAHIINVMAQRPGEPHESHIQKVLDAYYDELRGNFKYHVDPAPLSNGWSGPPLAA